MNSLLTVSNSHPPACLHSLQYCSGSASKSTTITVLYYTFTSVCRFGGLLLSFIKTYDWNTLLINLVNWDAHLAAVINGFHLPNVRCKFSFQWLDRPSTTGWMAATASSCRKPADREPPIPVSPSSLIGSLFNRRIPREFHTSPTSPRHSPPFRTEFFVVLRPSRTIIL
jgi:hypothetical protein